MMCDNFHNVCYTKTKGFVYYFASSILIIISDNITQGENRNNSLVHYLNQDFIFLPYLGPSLIESNFYDNRILAIIFT